MQEERRPGINNLIHRLKVKYPHHQSYQIEAMAKHYYSENIQDQASKGKLCPFCESENVKSTGSVPDGRALNVGYQCNDCQKVWEGY